MRPAAIAMVLSLLGCAPDLAGAPPDDPPAVPQGKADSATWPSPADLQRVLARTSGFTAVGMCTNLRVSADESQRGLGFSMERPGAVDPGATVTLASPAYRGGGWKHTATLLEAGLFRSYDVVRLDYEYVSGRLDVGMGIFARKVDMYEYLRLDLRTEPGSPDQPVDVVLTVWRWDGQSYLVPYQKVYEFSCQDGVRFDF